MDCDVAIIGGGPAGATLGTLLRKHAPRLSVAIVERERFPRDHVGESQLPAISAILDEMGVWDSVEAAGFPIKIGGTYRWGQTDELWDFEFVAGAQFRDEARPARYAGQRRATAFQVDRSIYDTILLDHAKATGCDVRQETGVASVERTGDRVDALVLSDGERLTARYYVDASGESGVLRRAMAVGTQAPTALRNIAIWDYWQDARWATTLGNGGTRIQVMSLGWGWLWFIPITPTRTSIGLVLPVDYYKRSGKTKEALYAEAIAAEPLIARLVAEARPEGDVQATKDWNFVADRLHGENWFLTGDAGGFADPILSAGMTLAHTSARTLAYTLAELERSEHDPAWLRAKYDEGSRTQIRHHMQFADYWYSSNGRFTDLKEYCSEIARTAGLSLDADQAFRWLATGGFALERPGSAQAIGFPLRSLKFITQLFGDGSRSTWEVAKTNFWRLDLKDAVEERSAHYENGRVVSVRAFRRGDKLLPLVGIVGHAVKAIGDHLTATKVMVECGKAVVEKERIPWDAAMVAIAETIEGLIAEGWVKAKALPSQPFLDIRTFDESPDMHPNRDNVVAV